MRAVIRGELNPSDNAGIVESWVAKMEGGEDED